MRDRLYVAAMAVRYLAVEAQRELGYRLDDIGQRMHDNAGRGMHREDWLEMRARAAQEGRA